jgi:lysyl-tRNA synthetase class 2
VTGQGWRQTMIGDHLARRARVFKTVRDFFGERDYLEVETPVRLPAPAPEAHIDAEPSGNWYLQTSPELCMKRLLSAGYPRLFQICRCFRRRERGRRHLPEFSLLEWYAAHCNYTDLMSETQDLIRHVARSLDTAGAIVYQNRRIGLETPWDRLTVAEAFSRYSQLSLEQALATGRFDEAIGLQIEPNLGLEKPVFLYDYPAAFGALARKKPGQPEVAERFELYIAGMELCNGFCELTDAKEQRSRFEDERELRRRLGRDPYPMPEPFLTALAGLPPSAGNALGLDRLVMLFCDVADIDSVTAFTPEEL